MAFMLDHLTMQRSCRGVSCELSAILARMYRCVCVDVVTDSSKGVCVLFVMFCSGVWNVPHVSGVYLVKGAWLKRHTPEYSSERFEVDMAFTAWMREKVGSPALHARCGNWGLPLWEWWCAGCSAGSLHVRHQPGGVWAPGESRWILHRAPQQ